MTLTADEIMRICKIARYNVYREKMGFKDGTKNELWNKDLKPINENIMETEQEDGLE